MSKTKNFVIEKVNKENRIPRFPHIKLKLIGVMKEKDIIGVVASKLRLSGCPETLVRVYVQNSQKACQSDVLGVARRWIVIEQ